MMEKQPHESIEKLLQGLQSKEYYVRKTSAEKIGRLGVVDEQVLTALESVAESDLNTYVRNAARQSYLALTGQEQQLSDDVWVDIPKEKKVLDREVSSSENVKAEAAKQDGSSQSEQPMSRGTAENQPTENEPAPLWLVILYSMGIAGIAFFVGYFLFNDYLYYIGMGGWLLIWLDGSIKGWKKFIALISYIFAFAFWMSTIA